MLQRLLINFFVSLFFLALSLLTTQQSFAQACNGSDGSAIYPGSIANRDNGTICANNPIQPALIEIDISNIAAPGPGGTIEFRIDWDDGSPFETILATRPNPVSEPTRYFASRTHNFPPNGGNVKCEYIPNVRLVFNGTLCAANLGTPPRFVRWNTDDENTGELRLEETITGVNVYEVCAGVETNVTFTDRSTLNCVPPELLQGANNRQRWRRFVYGVTNTITGTVRIAGVPQAFPFNGAVDASTEPTLNSGFPTATTQIITIPATAQVGQRFRIRMDYWNFCNQFPARPQVEEFAEILIVAQPPPPTSTDQTVCNGTTPNNFNLGGVPGGATVFWYRNVPGTPDAPGVLISSGVNQTNRPVTIVPGYTNNTTAGEYKVWASYRPNIANALNCESPRIPITRIIREALTVPNPTTAPPAEICNASTFSIVLPGPAATTFGGATEYQFNGAGGVTVGATTANSVTFNVAVAPGDFGGALFVDRTVSVTRRYTTGPNCPVTRNFTVRVYRQTVPGTITGPTDICEGANATLQLNGNVGAIVRWEQRLVPGAFAPYAGPAAGNTISPGATLTPGVYEFRAVVRNGTCAELLSPVHSLTVAAGIGLVDAGPDQNFCGVLTTGLNANLPAGTGAWTYISSIPTGLPAPIFSAPTSQTSNVTASAPGVYALRWTVTSGICNVSDDVRIDFGANPIPIPPMTEEFCGATGTLNAPVPAVGTGTWTVVGTPAGGTVTIDDINDPASAISLSAPITYGTYQIEWRVVSGICVSVFNTANVTFIQPPTVSANDFNFCLLPVGNTAIPLNAGTTNGTFGGGAVTGTWVVITGNSATVDGIAVAGNNVTGTYNAPPADYLAGTNIELQIQASSAGTACPAATQNITVAVDRTPDVDAGGDRSTCETFVQLNAEDPIPFGATGLWTGPGGVTFDDSTDPRTVVRNIPAGPGITLRWTLTSAGGNSCSDFEEITVQRVGAPSAININPILCETPPAGAPLTTSVILADFENNVTALPAADRTIEWFRNAPPPVGLVVADPTIALLNVPDGQVFVARIRETATNCTSDAFMTVNIRPLPVAINATVPLCEDGIGSNQALGIDLQTDLDFRNAVTTAGNLVSWFNTLAGAAADNPAEEITAPFDVTGFRDVFARIEYTNNPSCPAIATLRLQVNPLPVNATILGRGQVCAGDLSVPPNELPVETYQVTAVTGAKYFWEIPDGPGQFRQFGGGGENDFFVLLQFPSVTSQTIRVRVELNGCSTPVIELPITVSAQPVSPTIVGTDVVCENDDGIAYQIIPTNFPISNYSWSVRRQSNGTEGGGFVTAGQGTDNIFVRFQNEQVYISVRENNSICVSDTTQFWVTVNRRPVMMDVDPTACSDGEIGVVFQATGASPVPIDKYRINGVNTPPALNFVFPPAGPPFPVIDAPANAIQNHIFENLGAVPVPVNYNVTPISVGPTGLECTGTTQIITVTINPEPQLNPNLSRSVCSGEELGLTLVSAPNTFPADRFIITAIVIPPGVTAVVPGNIPVADGTTLYLDDVLFNNQWANTTGSNQVIEYRILPFSSILNCAGNPPTPIFITIFPQTDVDPVGDQDICNGDLLNITFSSGNNPDAGFLWTIKSIDPNITLGSPAAGVGNITNFIANNTSLTADGTITFGVRGKNIPTEETAEGCENPEEIFVVTVLKSPVANELNLSACSDSPGGSTFTADLRSLEPSVTPDAGDPDTQIIWYRTNPTLGPATVIAGADLDAFIMGDGLPVFVEVEFLPTGCKRVVAVEYTVNPNISIATTLSDFNGFNLSCNADNSGNIRTDVLTGSPVYAYRIDGGPFINAGVVTFNFSSLSAGLHTVEVQDARGCLVSETVTLIEPPALIADLAIDQEITCFLGKDGIIRTNVSGGTGTYVSFLLLQTNTTDPNNDGVFENLGEGSYNVRVTDLNNCRVDTDQVTLVQPTPVEINSLVVATDANGFNLSCRDAVDGEIAITFSGGNVPPDYTVTLTNSNDPGNPNIVGTTGFNNTFTSLGFGNYTAIVRDFRGCESLPASGIIVNPPPFSPGFIGINQAVCDGDDPVQIEQLVPAFGGVGNYQYQWQQSLTGSNNDAEWIDIPGAITTVYDPAVLAQTTYFRRLARSVSERTGIACQELGRNNIVQVVVNPLPVASFNAPSEVCQGEAFALQLGISSGTAPIEYDYSAGATTFLNLIGTENTSIPISNFQQPTTFTLTRVRDLNGCVATNVPQSVFVDIININPDFTVLAPAAQCSGGTFTFQWVAEQAVRYTWIWSDGQQDIINPGDVPLGINTITHVFTAGSTESSTIYPVRLQAENALCAPKFATKPITVFPTLVLNIIPGVPILCSGESIRFTDQSAGVDVGRWYYQILGTTNQQEIRNGPFPEVTYVLNNNTTTNPIFYEVVYEASNNEGCTAEFRQEVKVYRGITADIINTPDPPAPFAGGISTIEFSNNSTPLDETDFEYTWDFGDVRATPSTGTGILPYTVDYFSAGVKDVVLTAINIEARDVDNKTCQSIRIKPINIELPVLGAAFRVTPLASCFPTDLVIENLSPGADTFIWEIYNQSGLVSTSNLRDPVFTIQTPGTYDIYLTASFYATGQTATANQQGIEVFDVPVALFEMRPNPLYVPDTELQTFNQSARASLYIWDFDDGTTSNEFQPRHFYKLEGKYNVTLIAGFDNGNRDIDGDGILDGNVICYDTVRQELIALDGGFIKLPNAFTPSRNGPTGGISGSGTFNDVFLPIARGIEEFQMQIFDRWGNLIFESEDRNVGWDGYDRNGRLMPAGVYVFKLVLRLSDGQRTTKIGDVTLIR